jgi:hypothetical protein
VKLLSSSIITARPRSLNRDRINLRQRRREIQTRERNQHDRA